jgi:hypothetical protein
MSQTFSLLAGQYSVTRLSSDASTPDWVSSARDFVSVTRTGDELSIVCPSAFVPEGVATDAEWCCIKLKGPFAFDEVGILLSFAAPLAARGIGIFAISTFDTDYILVKEQHRVTAVKALLSAGHTLLSA